MKYIYPVVGIIFFCSYCIFIMNSQLKEIRSLKAQLSIESDYNQDLENDISTCKADVDFLKSSTEDLMKVCRMPR